MMILSAQFGISDVALKKTCARAGIRLTGKSFDSFLSANGDLLKSVQTQYLSSGEASAKDLLMKVLFRKRHRIVHFGKSTFSNQKLNSV